MAGSERGSLRLDRGATIKFVIGLILLGIAVFLVRTQFFDRRYVVGCVPGDKEVFQEISDKYNSLDPQVKIVLKELKDEGDYGKCDAVYTSGERLRVYLSHMDNQRVTDPQKVLSQVETVMSKETVSSLRYYPVTVSANHIFLSLGNDEGVVFQVSSFGSALGVLSAAASYDVPLTAFAEGHELKDILLRFADATFAEARDVDGAVFLGPLPEVIVNLGDYIKANPPVEYNSKGELYTGFSDKEFSLLVGDTATVGEILGSNPEAAFRCLTLSGDGLVYEVPVHMTAGIIPVKKKDDKLAKVIRGLYRGDVQKDAASLTSSLPVARDVEVDSSIQGIYDLIQSSPVYFNSTDTMSEGKINELKDLLNQCYEGMNSENAGGVTTMEGNEFMRVDELIQKGESL